MAWRFAPSLCLASLLVALLGDGAARAAPAADNVVDVQLVLAVDVSYSMDPDEQALQRDGYAAALVSDEFLNALRQGPRGRIAATYVEWAGEREQRVVLDWRIIDSPASARAFSDAIRAAPLRRVYRTSISSALLFSANHLKTSGYRGLRNVIDVSGDGVNNQGPPVEQARDEVVAQGITINGLPLLLKRSANSAIDIPDLDVYYEDCVIGGAGAFVIPVREQAEFARAIKTKLVLEVAGLRPPEMPRIIPAVSPPRLSCLIGERLWRENWNN
ncbi:DUF1194 domain-containing protein [Aquabacter sp. P-9]|uniref:DUF1194 domain-containing protein n=1 Tax=Aquabacter sediminis TaxID=3029197 RepID=UPI00237D89D3|nr:DUF1194 domain-containing protein [Aquabacter sp. P-9]MDE1568127.1 DUF1194 domain-containing protein [Aquabacter sp. P-9]